jgi:hypothetical protein
MRRSRLLSAVLSGVGVLGGAEAGVSQSIRLGPEFQVNTYTFGTQGSAKLAMDAAGDFIVVWRDYGLDGDENGVFARRFDSAGVGVGVQFQINTYTTKDQEEAAVGMDADGDFVAVWASSESDGEFKGVFARRFDSSGVGLGVEFQVNDYTHNNQRLPAVAVDVDGDFVVVWESSGQDYSSLGVFAHRFASSGVALGAEFQVNTWTEGSQNFSSLGMSADGDFVVVWQSYAQDGDDNGIFCQRFDSAGAPVGAEFQVNSSTLGAQIRPAVGMNGEGDFVVTWFVIGPGVFARSFDSAGVAVGAEILVASGGLLSAVAVEAAGGSVIAWHANQDGSAEGIFARRFDSAGSAIGARFQVNTYTTNSQADATVAVASSGDFVVAWSSRQYGTLSGVFAQRFGTPAILDVDTDGNTGALTDGLLVLRHLFGFTGSTLVNGAVGGSCGRCDSTAVASYLTALGSVLDVDDDGGLGALTDGLLVLRFLFGFTGSTLVNGAVASGCDRCTAPAIEAYLQALI